MRSENYRERVFLIAACSDAFAARSGTQSRPRDKQQVMTFITYIGRSNMVAAINEDVIGWQK